ncbi:carbohydrate ABC transporter permease [Rathayibacter festucae]|uniref:carbohydrate ABC transporter permease n=1 Tax=Rathayibacter festucae TaxID=110937 RepID=UPI002A6B80A8|nr:carbohydrate ABC transporter permease [Rathayibacter festucae]MDY0914528.1 carbohydrate ABC transporter permease [Rathayibacter festucae]
MSAIPATSRRRASKSFTKAPPAAVIIAWGYALVSSMPLLWLIVQSFRPGIEVLSDPWGVPLRPTLDGYLDAFRTTPLPQYFLNSLVVTVAVVLVSVAASAGAGYAFSRLRFPGSHAMFAVFIGVLVVPAPVLLLPVYLISGNLGILNTYIGLIAPYAAGILPIGSYLMKTHFDSLPDSYAEAAEIDRATPWQTFRLIMFPLIRPAAATVAVLAFMTAWNEYVYAVVALQSQELYTLPVGVADLSSKAFLYGYGPVLAAMVLTSIPVYVAFLLAQRSFLSSFAVGGGVKG